MLRLAALRFGLTDPAPLVNMMIGWPGADGEPSTVTWNTLLEVAAPSLTVIVIVATPLWPETGVTVTVRLAPLPPNTMLLTGISPVADEAADTVRLLAAVSTSPIVNAIALVLELVAIVWLPIAEMVGGESTVTVNVRVTVLLLPFPAPSLTVTVTVAEPDAVATGVNVSVPVALALV
jgi:hypothetical protein